MNADRLLALWDRIADAPEAAPRLRRFVLDLAVRGKLVEQDPADEPASALLERIAAEKARLVKAGEIKRKAAQNPKMAEAPYVLPASWSWVSLGTAFFYDAGAKRDPKSLDASRWLLELEDIEKETGRLLGRIAVSDRESKSTKSEFQVDDILYGKLRPYLTKVIVANEPGYSTTEIVAIRPFLPLCSEYCALAFRSPYFVEYVTRLGQGTKMPRLRTEDAVVSPFPLPPFAEQRRIVARVEELMTLLDRLEAARAAREATRDRLIAASLARLTVRDAVVEDAEFTLNTLPALTTRPDQIKPLRQTILNLAVRGKLVEQDPAEEPASELLERLVTAQKEAFNAEGVRKRKPVHRLERGDIPFDFPESWQLPNFDDLFVIVSGVTKGGRVPSETAVELPYLRVANVQRGHLDLAVIKRIVVKKSDQERYQLESGDILMTEGGDWDKLGRAAIWRNEIADCIHQNHIFRVRPPSQEILPEWVVIYVNSELGRRFFEDASKQTTNLASINMTQLRGCPIPLPALAEQHRIVAKVDVLMALCDRLEAALHTADTTRARLLDALLHEALDPAADGALEAAE